MVRYRMLGRDINSSPVQYRTWVVNDTPDFAGAFYTGLKSGTDPFVDITAYLITDPSAVVNFNLPDTIDWNTSFHVLPHAISNSSLAIIDGYVYLFGSDGYANIWRASLNNPADWVDTGATLPAALSSSQLSIISNTIYLFGGSIGGNPTNNIYTASTSNPLSWSTSGTHLPKQLSHSQIGIVDGYAYLIGGKDGYGATNSVLRASVTAPLTWTLVNTLPTPLYNSQLAIIDDFMYLYGGLTAPNTPSLKVWNSSIAVDPTFFYEVNDMPYQSHSAQVAVVGNNICLIGPTVGNSPSPSNARVLTATRQVPYPHHVVDSGKTVPGEVSNAQIAVIYDRLFLFGGNGSTIIYVADGIYKYSVNDSTAISYGNITRTQVQAASSPNDLFAIVGMPPWKTTYFNY